jgi:hypothetical protein
VILFSQKTKEERAEALLKYYFNKYAVEKGKLDKNHMGMLLQHLGETFSQEELSLFCRTIDTDHDGYIDFVEFKEAYHKAAAQPDFRGRRASILSASIGGNASVSLYVFDPVDAWVRRSSEGSS